MQALDVAAAPVLQRNIQVIVERHQGRWNIAVLRFLLATLLRASEAGAPITDHAPYVSFFLGGDYEMAVYAALYPQPEEKLVLYYWEGCPIRVRLPWIGKACPRRQVSWRNGRRIGLKAGETLSKRAGGAHPTKAGSRHAVASRRRFDASSSEI